MRLDSLTGLRFLAAFVVFGLHFGAKRLDLIFGQGSVGVSFFFVLSGLVLTWSWRPGDRARHFYRRRVARIYPAYLVGLALSAVITLSLHDAAHGVGGSIAAVFLLQAWFTSPSTYFVLNGVSWSLSVEAFFYLLFPLIVLFVVRLDRTNRRRLQLACLAVIVGLGIGGAFTVPGHASGVAEWLTYICPVPRLAEFVLGMTLVAEIRERPLRVPPIAIMALTLGAYLLARVNVDGLGVSAITIIPFCLLLVRMAQSDLARTPSVFRHRIVVRLGEASYCFYLLHQLVIRVVKHYINPDSPVKDIVVLLLALITAVIAAWLLHVVVERPLDRRLRGSGRPEVVVDGAQAAAVGASAPLPSPPVS